MDLERLSAECPWCHQVGGWFTAGGKFGCSLCKKGLGGNAEVLVELNGKASEGPPVISAQLRRGKPRDSNQGSHGPSPAESRYHKSADKDGDASDSGLSSADMKMRTPQEGAFPTASSMGGIGVGTINELSQAESRNGRNTNRRHEFDADEIIANMADAVCHLGQLTIPNLPELQDFQTDADRKMVLAERIEGKITPWIGRYPWNQLTVEQRSEAWEQGLGKALRKHGALALNNGHRLPSTSHESEADEPLRALSLGALYNLHEEWKQRPWVWDGILPQASLSMIIGKSESGKSTWLYALIYCVVRGLEFLGRQCAKGRVLYIAGDPASEFVAADTFAKLGLESDEEVVTVPGALILRREPMVDLRKIVLEFRPALVVCDTLGATVQMDTDSYGQSYRSQQPLVAIAREAMPNILVAHHSQKSAVEAYNVVDAALGSVGVAAVASSRMVTRKYRRGKNEFYTFEMSNLRIGNPIKGEWTLQKSHNGFLTLDGLWAERETGIIKQAILNALEESGGNETLTGIREAARMKLSKQQIGMALRELIAAQMVSVTEGGKKGKAKRYSLMHNG